MPVTGLETSAASNRVSVVWDPVPGATGYNLYWASEPYINSTNIHAFNNGDWQEDVSAPWQVNGLSNDQTYYFVVTATTDTQESEDSAEVSATPRSQLAQSNPSAQEVLMLELINRARFDPEAEAARFGIDLNQGLNPGTISSAQKPPLAHNRQLLQASRDHSQWMLNSDIFSHTGENGSDPGDRMAAAGYAFNPPYSYGENIAVAGTSGSSLNKTTYIYSHHQGLFESAGHRRNLLSTNFKEVGVGQNIGTYYFSGNYGDWFLSSMLTQSFAASGSSYFVSGVVYNDSNGNNFYDVGEGLGGANVSIGNANTTTSASGLYTLARSNGSYSISITTGGIEVNDTVVVNGANRKFDVIVNAGEATVNSW
ncbi:CAP domain-containing protein [Gilvimarinus sp. DA14]|uniref:CAP domain-containing protein n=1 Tax=Gilvimarinus sp. DA14 TaxID=2956798 RepID=UPI0020B663E9|nr:CAP domain-containing protein [Gilvimarinus sp. DA14]UTF61499.1 CAP domain-containing protein [Gilvimarinus sp. DA14]